MMSEEHDSPATLVAILVAAKKAGDRELEREMRRRLRSCHGVRLTFASDFHQDGGEVDQ